MNPGRLLFLVLLGLWQAGGVPAAFGALSPRAFNTGVPAAPDGQRFLFVIETSSSMEDLQAANEATLYEMIRRGVDGQMQTGDTYGIWTFNKVTTAGQFPMRVWEARKSMQQATIAAAFINQQTYEKSSNLKGMMEQLATVIHAVSNVTVFILSDGDPGLTGTPFDKQVNEDYRKLNRLRKQAKRQFVTTLTARDGWVVNAKVTIGGKPIELPPRPEPILVGQPPAQTNSVPTQKKPAGALLAIRELDTSTNGASLAQAQPPAPPTPTPTPTPPDVVLNAATPTPTPLPVPARPKVMQIITKPATPPPSLATNVAELPPPAPPPQLAQVNPTPETNQTAATKTTAPTPSPPSTNLATTIAAAAPVISNPSAPAAAASLAPVGIIPPSPTARSDSIPPASRPALSAAPVLSAAPAGEEPGVLSTLLAAAPPLSVAARELDPERTVSTAGTSARPAEKQVSAVEAMVGVQPPGSGFNWMLVFGAALMVSVGLLLVVVLRRLRPADQGSIITQSMGRR